VGLLKGHLARGGTETDVEGSVRVWLAEVWLGCLAGCECLCLFFRCCSLNGGVGWLFAAYERIREQRGARSTRHVCAGWSFLLSFLFSVLFFIRIPNTHDEPGVAGQKTSEDDRLEGDGS